MTDKPTKERILDAAERLYAAHGFAETSLRQLTNEAAVNLAAVHYHFGSKEGLFKALVERRIGPINEERIALLDELEASGRPTLEAVLEALVGPLLRYGARDREGAAQLFQVIGRLNLTDQAHAREFREVFQRTAERFVPALRRELPGVDEESFFWRLNFSIAVMAMTLCDPSRVAHLSEGACDIHDTESAVRHMVIFIAAGLRAEVPQASSEEAES